MKLQRFLQVEKCLFFVLALAGDVHFQALSDVPVALTPDDRGKRTLYESILPPARRAHNTCRSVTVAAPFGWYVQYSFRTRAPSESVGNFRNSRKDHRRNSSPFEIKTIGSSSDLSGTCGIGITSNR
jgi:hypothetical protein